MLIRVSIECLPTGDKLPDWDKLSTEVLKRLVPISELFKVVPQTCGIEAKLSKEEELRYAQ